MEDHIKVQCKIILFALLHVIALMTFTAAIIIAIIGCSSHKTITEVRKVDSTAVSTGGSRSMWRDSTWFSQVIIIDSMEYIYSDMNPVEHHADTTPAQPKRVKAYGIHVRNEAVHQTQVQTSDTSTTIVQRHENDSTKHEKESSTATAGNIFGPHLLAWLPLIVFVLVITVYRKTRK